MSAKEISFRPHLSISSSSLVEENLEKSVFSSASFFLLVKAQNLEKSSFEPAIIRFSSHLIDNDGGSLALQMQPSSTCSSGFRYKSQCVCFFDGVGGVEPYLCDERVSTSTVTPSSSPAPTSSPGGTETDEDRPGNKNELKSLSVSGRIPFLLAYVLLIAAIGGYMLRSMGRNKDDTEGVIITSAEREESDADREVGSGEA